MRAKFVTPSASIYYFTVAWDPTDLSWADFRGKLLGPTNPADAPAGSLRHSVLQQWKELGLESVPDKTDNGVHASASPFEALAERTNWLGAPIASDTFGSLALEALSEERIKSWSRDPQVTLIGGSKGSIFDALEDLDAQACLDKLRELNAVNGA